jgi:ATP-dependent DNA helicase RecG
MQFKESEFVELKRIFIDDIKKGIIAFANSNGGNIYIGISDNGEVIGVENTDNIILSINNMIRDAIKPDITLFVQTKSESINNKSIINIAVQRGTNRPYYLSGKGIRPDGVFVRHGASSVPATDTAIRRMIRETDGDSFEKLRSVIQEFTFESAEIEFKKRGIDFEAFQMVTLGIMTSDRIYTNLGFLLSDQSVHTIKAAFFQDTTQQIFKDRREFTGSLFKQINEVYDFIDMHSKTKATFDKLLRIDTRDYPEEAIREALFNAVVHREYSTSGSILIKIFSDRLEFISPGGLADGIELDDITSGYSVCRNQMLAQTFYRLSLIEAYGTGILKIFDNYADFPVKPKIEVTPNVFKMILPNKNIDIKQDISSVSETPQKKVLNFAEENGSVTRKQAEDLLELSQTAAGSILRKLHEVGYLIKSGGSKNTVYYINKSKRYGEYDKLYRQGK